MLTRKGEKNVSAQKGTRTCTCRLCNIEYLKTTYDAPVQRQKKEPKIVYFCIPWNMTKHLSITVDRTSKVTLAEQIYRAIANAIGNGVLLPDARLPSWRDLAVQLGVARGTVRTAYERLIDSQLVVSRRPIGTRVAQRPVLTKKSEVLKGHSAFIGDFYRNFSFPSTTFQMGVPAQECFPTKLVARLRARAVRVEAATSAHYPDPRGEPELRREIAAHLAMARGLDCEPSQIFITSGFSGALGLSLRVLSLDGCKAWIENPSFPLARKGLEIAGMHTVPIPVDAGGIDVEYGLKVAQDAALVVVSPGQQAPLGPSLSLARRIKLLEWAARTNAWVIEDDYLGELQLKGRAAPALASIDKMGRVIHIGSFSKTISPTLRLGFVVVPYSLIVRFEEATACLFPAPGPSVQMAIAELMRDGHYLRHLRKMKRIYALRMSKMFAFFALQGHQVQTAGLAILLRLPDHVPDVVVAKEAFALGLAPAPLSPWYASFGTQRNGLMLNVAAVPDNDLTGACERLSGVISQFN